LTCIEAVERLCVSAVGAVSQRSPRSRRRLQNRKQR